MKSLRLIFLLVPIISFAQKTITPEIGFTPDISGTAKQRFELKKKKYAELNARIEKGETYDGFTEPERRLFDEFDGPDGGADPWSVGSAGCSWYCGVNEMKITASSVLSPQGKNTYTPANAHDFTLNTAWVEGAKGPGIGQYIEYTFYKGNPPVTTVILFNGYVKSEKAWMENARIKKIKLYVNGKPYAFLALKDVKSEQSFKIGELQNKTGPLTLRFEIAEVYKGTKYEDTVLSELYFDGTGVHCFAAGTMITMADFSQKPIEQISPGDQILSYNSNQNSIESTVVEEVTDAMHHNLYKYNFGTMSIQGTDDHPFFGSKKTWVSLNPDGALNYVAEVGMLKTGDQIFSIDKLGNQQLAALSSASKLEGCFKTYTILRLSKNGNFFANGLLVSAEDVRTGLQSISLE
jgi:hypothetical protein